MLELDPVQLSPGPFFDIGPLTCDELQVRRIERREEQGVAGRLRIATKEGALRIRQLPYHPRQRKFSKYLLHLGRNCTRGHRALQFSCPKLIHGRFR